MLSKEGNDDSYDLCSFKSGSLGDPVIVTEKCKCEVVVSSNEACKSRNPLKRFRFKKETKYGGGKV